MSRANPATSGRSTPIELGPGRETALRNRSVSAHARTRAPHLHGRPGPLKTRPVASTHLVKGRPSTSQWERALLCTPGLIVTKDARSRWPYPGNGKRELFIQHREALSKTLKEQSWKSAVLGKMVRWFPP